MPASKKKAKKAPQKKAAPKLKKPPIEDSVRGAAREMNELLRKAADAGLNVVLDLKVVPGRRATMCLLDLKGVWPEGAER